MAAFVELKRVSYSYPGCARILKAIDLSIPAGEMAAVFGTSGSGKSTLAFLLNGLIPHFFEGNLEGTVVIAGHLTRKLSVSELFPHVGLVLQNTDAQLFNATVEGDLVFGLESLGLDENDIRVHTRRAAEELGITHLLKRSPETLSAGEKRLAAIASVLCLGPALIVLDEPFAGLDNRGARKVREILGQIRRRRLTNLIIIEHRMDSFTAQADRSVVLDQGRIRFDGPTDKAAGVLSDLHLTPRYLERVNRSRVLTTDPILAVKGLGCRIRERNILSDISLNLNRGEALAIVGENGAGKTTLIKHIGGLLQPTTGEVTLEGRRVGELTPAERAAGVGLCFQNPNDQFFEATVRREILVGPQRAGKIDWIWFEHICEKLDLRLLLDRSPLRLSEGEKRRVAVASVLVMRPKILLLDEPTAGQDGRFKENLAALCISIGQMGITTVVVTHDLDFARATADRWIVLHAGQIADEGAPDRMHAKLMTLLEGPSEQTANQSPVSNGPTVYADISPGVDPRAKLIFLITAVAAVLVTRRPATLAAESLLLLGILFCVQKGGSRVPIRRLFGSMTGLVFVIGLVFFDLSTALTLAARLFALLATSFVFFQAVGPDETAGALRKLRVPFGGVFILTTGMRYVPLIGRLLRGVVDAQQARGIDLRPRFKNLANFTALLVPLVVQAFALSDQLALAMESRGFGRKNRSCRRNDRLRPVEYVLMAAALIGLGLLVWWERG